VNAPSEGLRSIDVSVPHPARRYDFWLGGKDNFEVDRASGLAVMQRWPGIVTAVRENRLFLGRAVRYAAAERGVCQFLDIGTGLPTVQNTHEVAQRIAPASRIVYVDNDPLVLAHARALLTSVPEGETAYLDADLRDPGQILDRAAQTLNFAQPVALMLVAVLHFLPDLHQARSIVRRLSDVLAPGSLLVLSHGSYDLVPAENARLLTKSPYPGSGDFFPRTREQIGGFFQGWDPAQPRNDRAGRAGPDQPVGSAPARGRQTRCCPIRATSRCGAASPSSWTRPGRRRWLMAEPTPLPDVTLERSNLGGFMVLWRDEPIGWIHENGDRWNAYLRAEPPRPGVELGRFPKADAVRKIATTAGWPGVQQ